MYKKKVIVYGHNYAPELIGIGKYTAEMVTWLVDHDYQCTVVTGFPYYPYWKVQEPYKNNFYKKEVLSDKLTIYRCPIYIPEKPSGSKRIIHDASFFLSSFFVFIRLLFQQKADYVITIAPPFHSGLIALFYRFFKAGRIVYHIQDLQIDAARDLKLVKSNALFTAMFAVERFIIKKVDFVSSISAGMIGKIMQKVQRPVLSLPNWADLAYFKPLDNRNAYKLTWGYDIDDYVILYSGNLGEKQGLHIISDIAAKLKVYTKIKIVVCGTGVYKDTLQDNVKANNLTNVSFLPLQKYEVFNEFLNMADMHLVLQKKDASDLVMPSKLTTILSVGGLALVTALPGTTLYDMIKYNDIGLLAMPEDLNSVYDVIVENVGKSNIDLKLRARKFAEVNFSVDNIMAHFLNSIQ